MVERKGPIIVSACLAGIRCRYDGLEKSNEQVIQLVKEGRAIPLCPEQLGGLPTPRQASERNGLRVVTQEGVDLTEAFNRGAQEALKIARLTQANTAILKARSPSCGVGIIYDGTFSGTLISGDGIFAELCKKEGIVVLSEEDLVQL